MNSNNGDFNEIIPRMYLGKNWVKNNRISHVLSLGFPDPLVPDAISYNIDIKDTSAEYILPYFDKSFEFIQKALADPESVLYVHCIAGVSRSPSIVIAYFMKLNTWSFKEAFAFVVSKRRYVDPNAGFRQQLLVYEKCGNEYHHSHPLVKRYLALVQFHKEYDQQASNKPLEPVLRPTHIKALKCRKCRTLLVNSSSIIYHVPEEASTPQRKKTEALQPGSQKSCDLYFIEPEVEWLPFEKGKVEAKLRCPNCDCKLGYYNWAGLSCTCGKWVAPAVNLQKAKVDEIK